jgi:hypothetical protein
MLSLQVIETIHSPTLYTDVTYYKTCRIYRTNAEHRAIIGESWNLEHERRLVPINNSSFLKRTGAFEPVKKHMTVEYQTFA